MGPAPVKRPNTAARAASSLTGSCGGETTLAGAATIRRWTRDRWALIAASVALHVALLLPLALAAPGLIGSDGPEARAVMNLELWPHLRTRPPGRAAQVPESPRRTRLARDGVPPPPDASAPVGPPASDAIEARAGPAAAALGDPWARRPLPGPYAPRSCPPAPGDRRGRAICQGALAAAEDEEMETFAGLDPSRRDRSDRRREEGFDRQAEANEAWRAYIREDGAYPGLRSLFSER